MLAVYDSDISHIFFEFWLVQSSTVSLQWASTWGNVIVAQQSWFGFISAPLWVK